MRSRCFAYLFIVLAVLFSFCSSFAKTFLKVKERISVYAKPQPTAVLLGELKQGQVVLVSDKVYGKYLKVLFINKPKTVGFILRQQIQFSTIHSSSKEQPFSVDEKSSQEEEGQVNSGTHYARIPLYGVELGGSYFQQNKRYIGTASDQYTLGPLTGLGGDLRIFYEHELRLMRKLRWIISVRQVEYEGNIALSDSPQGEVSLSQTLLGGAVLYKSHFSVTSGLWWGVEAEVGKVFQAKIEAEQIDIAEDAAEKPTFFYARLAGGLDRQISSELFFTSSIRLSVVANTEPMILSAGALVGLAFKY